MERRRTARHRSAAAQTVVKTSPNAQSACGIASGTLSGVTDRASAWKLSMASATARIQKPAGRGAGASSMARIMAPVIAVREGQERILGHVAGPVPPEVVPITRALSRVVADDVQAPFDVPPADNSAVDGYAVGSADIPASGTRELDGNAHGHPGHHEDAGRHLPGDAPAARPQHPAAADRRSLPSGVSPPG